MKNELVLFSIFTCFIYVSKTIEGLRCFACTSMVTPECCLVSRLLEYYKEVGDDCSGSEGNFTRQCATLIWQESHFAVRRPTFYVKRLCSHPTDDYEFCNAYRVLAMEMGYNQTECTLCKKNNCNSKQVNYDGSRANKLSTSSLLCALSTIAATAMLRCFLTI